MSWNTASRSARRGDAPERTDGRRAENFFDRVYDIVRSVPAGQVISYGQTAFLAGNPRMARQVGWALHVCPGDVPWHRVVRKDGSLPALSPEASLRQRRLLEAEGVIFDETGRVLRAHIEESACSAEKAASGSVQANDALEGP